MKYAQTDRTNQDTYSSSVYMLSVSQCALMHMLMSTSLYVCIGNIAAVMMMGVGGVGGGLPLYNYSSRFEGSLGGDALGVQGMDVLASGQNSRVPDRVSTWTRLHILAF